MVASANGDPQHLYTRAFLASTHKEIKVLVIQALLTHFATISPSTSA